MNSGTLQGAQQETIIDFPIAKVKTVLAELFRQFSTKFMLEKDGCNEIFNTYHFTIVRGLIFAITDLALCEMPDNKTKVAITAKNAHGSSTSNAILSGMINDFTTVFGKMLGGESVASIKQTVKNSGCLVFLLIGLASLAIMSFYVL